MTIYSVAQINAYIHGKFERDSVLRMLCVKGELSNVKYHSAGHIYFTLKDNRSAIAGVMFAGNRRTLDFRLQEGQEVIITGSISSYERDGRYQIYASTIKLSGEGELFERYEKLRKELEEMGMFDPCYKKPIPEFVKRLGVVTAPTGAAVRDIINVSKRRFPYIEIILYPAKVQGDGAAESVAAGIKALDALSVDCIIAGRGGGSIEDLWAFNEEIVARAIFECETPVISAVGHETDTTIADWVADMRAPTPSAAAELAVFDYSRFLQSCLDYRATLEHMMRQKISFSMNRLQGLEGRLMAASPKAKLKDNMYRIAAYEEAMHRAINKKIDVDKQRIQRYPDIMQRLFERKLTERKHSLQLYISQLEGLSPLLKLSQGYSLAEGIDGNTISSIKQVKRSDNIRLHVQDGEIMATVTDIKATVRG